METSTRDQRWREQLFCCEGKSDTERAKKEFCTSAKLICGRRGRTLGCGNSVFYGGLWTSDVLWGWREANGDNAMGASAEPLQGESQSGSLAMQKKPFGWCYLMYKTSWLKVSDLWAGGCSLLQPRSKFSTEHPASLFEFLYQVTLCYFCVYLCSRGSHKASRLLE